MNDPNTTWSIVADKFSFAKYQTTSKILTGFRIPVGDGHNSFPLKAHVSHWMF